MLEEFVRYQHRRNLRPSTIEHRARLVTAFRAALGGDAYLSATADDIVAYLDACDLKPRTRGTYLSVLSTYYDWLVKVGRLTENPAAELDRPKTSRLLPRPVADDDLQVALDAASPLMRAWLCLAAFAGFRCYEMAHELAEDVLWRGRPPTILVSDGKGGHQRVVPLHDELAHALRALDPPTAGHLFTMKRGGPYKASTISTYISRHYRSLGLSGSAHPMRHWFGTGIYRRTRDLRLTQELMGHADPRTTAGYAAYSPGEAAAAVQGLGLRA